MWDLLVIDEWLLEGEDKASFRMYYVCHHSYNAKSQEESDEARGLRDPEAGVHGNIEMPPRDAQAEGQAFEKAVWWGEVEQIRGAAEKEGWVLVAQLQRGIPAAGYLLDMVLSTASMFVPPISKESWPRQGAGCWGQHPHCSCSLFTMPYCLLPRMVKRAHAGHHVSRWNLQLPSRKSVMPNGTGQGTVKWWSRCPPSTKCLPHFLSYGLLISLGMHKLSVAESSLYFAKNIGWK